MKGDRYISKREAATVAHEGRPLHF